MRKQIVGNWKMNGLTAQLDDVGAIDAVVQNHPDVDSALCLPATLIAKAVDRFPRMAFGGQDCHALPSGAHTGCVSAMMLADAGAQLTIVGHSERRMAQCETDTEVCRKAVAARGAGLRVIVCVGETEAQRDAGRAEEIVLAQLHRSLPDDASDEWLSIAYEPVWAIGTGRVPSVDDVAAMHEAIRNAIVARFGSTGHTIHILYGGSMNGDNAAALLSIPNVDGGLIGGASLTAEKFVPIIEAATTAPAD